jgi:hypothetical protein
MGGSADTRPTQAHAASARPAGCRSLEGERDGHRKAQAQAAQAQARPEDPHNLWLVREVGTGAAHSFGEEPSGPVVSKTVPLTAGRWTLFCPLTEHEAAGMRATLTVG